MKYELLYVLPSQYTDAELPAVQEKIASALQEISAAVTRHDHAGKLKIAYPIRKNRFGHYFLAEFEAEPARVARLSELLRLNPEVIRFGVTKRDPALAPRQTLLSHEEAVSRARALRETVRAAAPSAPAAPAARPAPAAASAAPRTQLSEEEIEQKIEKLLSEEEGIK